VGGNGGAGSPCDILGALYYWGGGGAGYGVSGAGAAGGTTTWGQGGTLGNGYGGFCVVRYRTADFFSAGSGGVISYAGGWTIHYFTGNGTFVAPVRIPPNAKFLIFLMGELR
jgi:hypothetical protein